MMIFKCLWSVVFVFYEVAVVVFAFNFIVIFIVNFCWNEIFVAFITSCDAPF